MKKYMLILSAAVMIAVIVFCLYVQDGDAIHSVQISVSAEGDVTQHINLDEKYDTYYAFLPAYADPETIRISHGTGLSLYLDGEYYGPASSLANIIPGREYLAEIKNSFGSTVYQAGLIFMQADRVPTLSITLVDGTLDEINSNKELSKSGYIALINADKTLDYAGELRQIHGRGNSSWDQHKKPYALEFAQDIELLNMGSHSCYVLVANALDESNLRNKIVYDAAQALGMPNSVQSEFVDLYVNGDYIGLYLLTNKLSIFENEPQSVDLLAETEKVNQYPLNRYETFEEYYYGMYRKGYSIANNPADITGSYLLEFELSTRVDRETNLFITESGQAVTVKAPKYASAEQMEYISNYMQNLEDLLGTEEAWTILDEESWSKYYLMQEVFANISRSSFFFYKHPDGEGVKLMSGPLWDFDLSMGTSYGTENALPYALYGNWGWFEKHNSNEAVMNRIREWYRSEVRPIIQEIISDKIDEYQTHIEKSYLMNEARWSDIQYTWWVNRYDTQQEHGDYLKRYLSERLKYLDYLWLGGEKPREVMVNESGTPTQETNDFAETADRLMRMLNNEQHYRTYGISLFMVIILVCCGSDLKNHLKSRRKSNGQKR